ncbi:MAG: MFS transporter [Candidatus Adiutrix intracellularis]|nr:MFS transporter [Candidatus Adiutrix intracellularis]
MATRSKIRNWRPPWKRNLITSFMMGFTSGVPLLVMLTLVQAWLAEAGIDLKTIGTLTLTSLPRSLKFTWSFWMDSYDPPCFATLGRRRGWLLLSQSAVTTGLLTLSLFKPTDILAICILGFFITLASATQDVVVDAYRREDLADDELIAGSAAYIWGYRLGMLTVGGGGLIAAEPIGLPLVYRLVALLMLAGPLTLIFSPEPDLTRPGPARLCEVIVQPIVIFFRRPSAIIILLFIFFYKFGDQLATTLNTVYYLELGYNKQTIGTVSKIFGFLATLTGVAGGAWIGVRLGLKKSLWLFGLLQMVSTMGFAILYYLPVHPAALGLVVSQENLAAGAGSTAFVAFMTNQTTRRFSAAQYALLSSFMTLPGTLMSAPAGYLAETLSWPGFYLLATALALPSFIILHCLNRRGIFS